MIKLHYLNLTVHIICVLFFLNVVENLGEEGYKRNKAKSTNLPSPSEGVDEPTLLFCAFVTEWKNIVLYGELVVNDALTLYVTVIKLGILLFESVEGRRLNKEIDAVQCIL